MMPRPPRCRRIGGYPDHWSFSPDDAEESDIVTLTLDEFETIRLLDREGLTQEEAAARMNVARTTVTAIYDGARRKLAQVLVDGKRLRIAGGSYQLQESTSLHLSEKGQDTMRLAIPYEDGMIFQHFGHTERFKLYDIQEGRITSTQLVDTNGSGHGALAGFLKVAQVDALICGGIGMGARMALQEAGIALYPGVSGPADEAARALAEGNLSYDPDAHCDHHDHHGEGHDCHHGEEYTCGHHCGENE